MRASPLEMDVIQSMELKAVCPPEKEVLNDTLTFITFSL